MATDPQVPTVRALSRGPTDSIGGWRYATHSLCSIVQQGERLSFDQVGREDTSPGSTFGDRRYDVSASRDTFVSIQLVHPAGINSVSFVCVGCGADVWESACINNARQWQPQQGSRRQPMRRKPALCYRCRTGQWLQSSSTTASSAASAGERASHAQGGATQQSSSGPRTLGSAGTSDGSRNRSVAPGGGTGSQRKTSGTRSTGGGTVEPAGPRAPLQQPMELEGRPPTAALSRTRRPTGESSAGGRTDRLPLARSQNPEPQGRTASPSATRDPAAARPPTIGRAARGATAATSSAAAPLDRRAEVERRPEALRDVPDCGDSVLQTDIERALKTRESWNVGYLLLDVHNRSTGETAEVCFCEKHRWHRSRCLLGWQCGRCVDGHYGQTDTESDAGASYASRVLAADDEAEERASASRRNLTIDLTTAADHNPDFDDSTIDLDISPATPSPPGGHGGMAGPPEAGEDDDDDVVALHDEESFE